MRPPPEHACSGIRSRHHSSPTPAAFQLAPAVTSQALRELRKAATSFFFLSFFHVHEFPDQMLSTLHQRCVVGRPSESLQWRRKPSCAPGATIFNVVFPGAGLGSSWCGYRFSPAWECCVPSAATVSDAATCHWLNGEEINQLKKCLPFTVHGIKTL